MRFACLVAVALAGACPSAPGSSVVRSLTREARSKGPLPVRRGGAWGYIDHSGKITIPPTFDRAGFFYEGLAAVEVHGKWGFIDISGRIVIPPRFTTVASFSDGLAGVFVDAAEPSQSLYGYIDPNGQIVIRCPAACGRPYSEGRMAEAVEVFRCVDPSGKAVQQQYPCASGTGRSSRPVLVDRWGYFDRTGKLVIPTLFHAGLSRFSEGLAAVQPDELGKMVYIDTSGNVVIAHQFDRAEAFSEGLAAVQMGDKWGFVDHYGQLVVTPQFEAVGAFSDGYAVAVVNGKAGYVDHKGQIAVQPRYSEAEPFSEGLAAVCCEGGKTGYIDRTGSFAIPAKYPGARVGGPFSEGVALVSMKNESVYIDRSGRVIAPVGGDPSQMNDNSK